MDTPVQENIKSKNLLTENIYKICNSMKKKTRSKNNRYRGRIRNPSQSFRKYFQKNI